MWLFSIDWKIFRNRDPLKTWSFLTLLCLSQSKGNIFKILTFSIFCLKTWIITSVTVSTINHQIRNSRIQCYFVYLCFLGSEILYNSVSQNVTISVCLYKNQVIFILWSSFYCKTKSIWCIIYITHCTSL